ncbi:DUF2530 domain-containing protein [Bifidobacterium gallicum]|nr:DUF2530 domain-containing protein [Bifidobacterium gallicum]KFI59652.1 hypothetical protein BGLCM_0321 [Bifidobacterium gallicum DSM 20093 = LMG 11596]
MKFAPLYDPNARKESPKPVQVDLRKVFGIGLALWIIAFVVVLVMMAMGQPHMHNAFVITLSGVIIGICLLIWEFFDRSDYRRLGAD